MSKRRIICDVIIVICLVLLVIAGRDIFDYLKDKQESFKIYEELNNDISKAWKINNDVIGWIKIPKTKISYPVLMPPRSNPDFYLHRDIKKKESLRGSLFADSRTDLLKSKNLIIYGHHMQDGTMFGDIIRYSDYDFYKSHRLIKYTSIDRNGLKRYQRYKVIAMFKSTTHDKESYLDYANLTTEDAYQKYISYISKRSEISFTKPSWPDRILTLSTCSYHLPRWAQDFHDGRYCVVAVRTK